jgi:hypothetical protein
MLHRPQNRGSDEHSPDIVNTFLKESTVTATLLKYGQGWCRWCLMPNRVLALMSNADYIFSHLFAGADRLVPRCGMCSFRVTHQPKNSAEGNDGGIRIVGTAPRATGITGVTEMPCI